MRASIRQVAELAQVSPMTVTRVLQGHEAVTEETRQRVLGAVRQTNYIPVRSVRQNRHVRTNILGLVPYHVNVMRNRIDSETYEGVCNAARKHGYDLLVMLRDESEWMAERKEIRFLDRRSDGFLFVSTGRGEWQEVLEALVQHEIPAVVCYRRDVPEGVAWIDPDNDAIVRLVIESLVKQGHKRLAYLTTHGYDLSDAGHLAKQPIVGGNFDDHMRRSAFERIAGEMGCVGTIIESVRPDWYLEPSVLDEIRANGITGVVCVNDLLALRLWDLATAVGLRVPEDLSLTGVDNSPEAELRGLTSVDFGYERVGNLAVEAWVQRMSGDDAESCCRVVPVQLYERRSIAPPKR